MSVLALRVLYSVWLIGWALLMIKAVSSLVFSHYPDKGRRFLKALILGPFWPLALFSSQGREALRLAFFYKPGVER